MPVIDIHTHCAPRVQGDPLGVAEALRGAPVGRNTVTNYRGLPAVSYHEMSGFDLQQEILHPRRHDRPLSRMILAGLFDRHPA